MNAALAVVPLCHFILRPRSKLSSTAFVPNVIIGSATSTTVELTVVVVPLTVKLPSITALPETSKFPPTLVLPVDVITPVTVIVEPSKVKLPESSISPAVPARTTLPSVKSLTLALDNVAAPVLIVPVTVALPLTVALPPIVASAVTDKPVPLALLAVSVSATSAVPFASKAPVNVVVPVTASVLDKVVAPETPNVPAVLTLPVVSATVNLLVSHAIPPFAFNLPVNVVTPVTPNVPPTVAFPPVVNASVKVTLSGKPIVIVSVADTATFTSFAVPAIVTVSPEPPVAIVCVVEPSLNVQPLDNCESMYALVAASCADVGSVTFVILLLPASSVCEPATVQPPSKSAGCANVAVPVTVTVSTPALPNVILLLNEALPVTVSVSLNVVAPETPNVVLTVVAPLTANVEPLNVKLALSSTEPEAPPINTLSLVKSVTRKLPNAALPNEPVITEAVSVAS